MKKSQNNGTNFGKRGKITHEKWRKVRTKSALAEMMVTWLFFVQLRIIPHIL